MRPIMNRDELAIHEIVQHGRDYSKSDDGYGDMEVASTEGWHALAGWGRDGWDLGDWPYVVISKRDLHGTAQAITDISQALAGPFQMRQTIEGDTTVYGFMNVEDRDAAIDYLFIWYALGMEHKRFPEFVAAGLTDGVLRAQLDAGTLDVPELLRGPFSFERLEAETAK